MYYKFSFYFLGLEEKKGRIIFGSGLVINRTGQTIDLILPNSYRYGHDDAYDVQPVGMQLSVSSDSKSPKASSSEHSGKWRDHEDGSLTQLCSLPGQEEGPLCAHGSGLIRTSHWSCCGARKRNAPCKPDGDSSDNSGDSGSEDDMASFLRGLRRGRVPSATDSPASDDVPSWISTR